MRQWPGRPASSSSSDQLFDLIYATTALDAQHLLHQHQHTTRYLFYLYTAVKCHCRNNALPIELRQGHGLKPLLPKPSGRCTERLDEATGRLKASPGVSFGSRAADVGGERLQAAHRDSKTDDAASSFVWETAKPATKRLCIPPVCVAALSPEDGWRRWLP